MSCNEEFLGCSRGPRGPEGPPGPVITETSGFAANTTGPTLTVILVGTNVPLPDAQNLNGITPNGTNTEFTVSEAGRYFIQYNINFTLGLAIGARILVNGTPLASTVRNPVLTISNLNAFTITNLNAGDTITLQLFGLAGLATLQDGQGAALTIIRLDD